MLYGLVGIVLFRPQRLNALAHTPLRMMNADQHALALIDFGILTSTDFCSPLQTSPKIAFVFDSGLLRMNCLALRESIAAWTRARARPSTERDNGGSHYFYRSGRLRSHGYDRRLNTSPPRSSSAGFRNATASCVTGSRFHADCRECQPVVAKVSPSLPNRNATGYQPRPLKAAVPGFSIMDAIQMHAGPN